MNTGAVTAVLMLLACVGVCACSNSGTVDKVSMRGSEEAERRPAAAFPPDAMSPKELELESIKAVNGDPVAAERVASFYAFVDPMNKDMDFWIAVAVENGSPIWIEQKAKQLADDGGRFKCLRALYWTRRGISLHPEERARFEAVQKALKVWSTCPSLRDVKE